MKKTSIIPGLEPAGISISDDGERLTINRNTRTRETGKAVSDYLRSLDNLTVEQNDTLVQLIITHVMEAERGAFAAGADFIFNQPEALTKKLTLPNRGEFKQ